MNIEKHGNKWRIRQMDRGHLYVVSLDHKPTKAEAVQLLAQKFSQGVPQQADLTFQQAAGAYVESKRNILSPATLKEYTRTAGRLPAPFCALNIAAITSLDVQKVVNDLAADHNPKTVANYAHFIMAVLRAQDISLKAPQLPQRIKKTPYIPTENDVKAVLAQMAGTQHELALLLCCFGLRRSEVCALTIDDIEGCVVHVNKAMVQDENKNYVIKTTKTTESTRDVVIPSDLADRIRAQGYVYKCHPDTLYKYLLKAQKRAGVPQFSLHKLRHFFASYLHQKGYTDKQIQEMGGWKTDNVMKTVYQHAMEMDAAKQKAAADIAGLFS